MNTFEERVREVFENYKMLKGLGFNYETAIVFLRQGHGSSRFYHVINNLSAAAIGYIQLLDINIKKEKREEYLNKLAMYRKVFNEYLSLLEKNPELRKQELRERVLEPNESSQTSLEYIRGLSQRFSY